MKPLALPRVEHLCGFTWTISIQYRSSSGVIHCCAPVKLHSFSSSHPRSNEKLSWCFCSGRWVCCQRASPRAAHRSNTAPCLFSHRKINHPPKYLRRRKADHLRSQQGACVHRRHVCFCTKLIFKQSPWRNNRRSCRSVSYILHTNLFRKQIV